MADDSWAGDIAKAGTGGAAPSGTQLQTPQPLTEAGMARQEGKTILEGKDPSEEEALKPSPTYAELDRQLTTALEELHLQGTAGAMPAVPP